jgi:hypothetical protein
LEVELIEIPEEEDGEEADFDPNDEEYLARCAEILWRNTNEGGDP